MEQYCPHCGDQQEVIQTVSWQANVCQNCGNDIDADED